MIPLTCGSTTAIINAEHGGRVASLVIGGAERLVTLDDERDRNPLMWGSFLMAPWAGRLRNGQFAFEGTDYELPIDFPPHAIHGTVYHRPWEVGDYSRESVELTAEFGPVWPFGGHLVQRYRLDGDSLDCTVEVHADKQPMPVVVGWHPWFRRPVELTIEAEAMLERDGEGIPAGDRVPPTLGPWDDCLVGVRSDPTLTWPDGLTMAINSSCDHWVVFDLLAHAVCLEPQSGPPDGLNLGPERVEPDAPLLHSMTLRWL